MQTTRSLHNQPRSTRFLTRRHRNTSSTSSNPSTSNPLIISSYTHIPSTKQITTTHRSISESTALSSTKRPIKLKRTFKHLNRSSSSYLFNEDSLPHPIHKTKPFIPTNAISVSERKLIRKISLRISSNEPKSSRPKPPHTSSKPSSSKLTHLLFTTRSSSSHQQLNNNITKSLHIIHSINTLQDNINNYTKEFNKHKTPRVPGLVRSRSGSIIKPNHSCSLYIKQQPQQTNLIQRLINSDNNNTSNNEYMSAKFKQAIKWEGIYQLWKNHSIVLETLINKYGEYKWFLDKNEYITDQTLKEFMRILRIESSSVFFKDVFDLFGFDNNICKYYYNTRNKESKIVNVKMFFQRIVSSAMTGALETKVEMLCNIWEHVHTKVIYVKEVLYLLKECLFYVRDYDVLKKILNKQFHYCNGDNCVSKKEFYNYIISHYKLRLVFQRNLFVDYNKVHQIFKEEVLTAVNSTEQNWKQYLSLHNMKEYNIGVVNRLERVLSSISKSQERKKAAIKLKYNKQCDIA